MNIPTTEDKLPAIWYGLGAILAIPIVAIMLLISSIALLLFWPVAPFVFYNTRRKEINAVNT